MIRVEHIEHFGSRVALLILDRREKRNALTPDMLANIRRSAELIHTDRQGAGALVLAGEGPAFCAGFDLSLCRDDSLAMAALLTRLSEAVRAIRRLPIPVVAAAQGAAIAGGCALLAAADIVVTDAEARIGYPVVKIGVSPAVNGPLVALAIGEGHARERMLDPALIDGREALRIGLAHECLEHAEDVRGRALDLAAELAAKPHHAMYVTKHWLNELDGVDRDEPFAGALEASLAIAGGAEERERLAAMWGGA